MSAKNKKIVITAAVVIIPVIAIIYSNIKTSLVRQLNGPIEGTEAVVSIGSKLHIVSKNNHIYTWQWDDLKKWPLAAKPAASAIVPIENDKIIYNPANSGRLVITNLKAETELAAITMPYGAEIKKIKTSRNGKFIAAAIIIRQGTQKDAFKMAVFDANSKEPSFVFQKNTKETDFAIYDFAVSNDGKYLAAAGEKEDSGWIFIIDAKNQSIIWEKTDVQFTSFTCIKFSPDEKTIFAAEKVRRIFQINAENGQTIKEFVMDEYRTPSNQKQNISCIDISGDGKTLAADTEPARIIWFWDIDSGQKIGQIYASDLTVSDIAFSPDSKYIASGCLVSPEIKIWKTPKLKNNP